MRDRRYSPFGVMPIVILTLLLSAITAQSRSLTVAVGGEPDNGFDPMRGWGTHGNALFQSTLLTQDETLTIQGDLARSWSLSDDRTVWSIRLRDDVRFSDGERLTADDVKFTYEQTARNGGLVDLSVLDRVEVTSPTGVRIHLSEPRVTFMRQMATLGIVPEHAYRDGEYSRSPVGSGPLRLVDWQEGSQMVVEPNPYWYGNTVPFDRITFLFTGPDSAFAMARSGRLDLVAVSPTLAAGTPAGMTLLNVPSVDNRGIAYPMRTPGVIERDDGKPVGNAVTSSRAIRQAINVALDREALVDLAVNGFGRPAQGPADGLPWNNTNDRIESADIPEARRILDRAGWHMTNRGVREKEGVVAQFDLLYPAKDTVRQTLAIGVSQQLDALGLDIRPSAGSWSELTARMHADPIVLGWGAHTPLEIWNLYHSSRQGLGYFNTGYYSNSRVDGHFAAAQSADSLEESLPHWQAAQWDGTTGFGNHGDIAWSWLINLGHTYFVNECLDLGRQPIHPHGHGFPITSGIARWQWVCD